MTTTDAYLLAAHVARRAGCTHVLQLGCADTAALVRLHTELEVVGFGAADDIARSREAHRRGRWIEWDYAAGAPPPPEVTDLLHPFREVLPFGVVVCTDSARHATPAHLAALHALMEYAPAGVVLFPPSADPGARRAALEVAGLRVLFAGSTTSPRDALVRGGEEDFALELGELAARHGRPEVATAPVHDLVVLANNHAPAPGPAPDGYRVVALMAVYNEQDVLASCLEKLIEQDVDVYVLDNWSNDRSHDIATGLLGRGVVQVERFPPEGRSDTWEWARMLQRMEAVATEVDAAWCMHTDADEIRRSPWQGMSLRDALHFVDLSGFTAVDHTALHFRPVDDGYAEGADLEGYFGSYSYDPVKGNQVKTWRRAGARVFLAGAGHRATWAGRRVYPYNFLYKHYPIRSQAHGERKLYAQGGTRSRYRAEERDAGWLRHYDEWGSEHNFLRDPARLRHFSDAYYRDNLVELLASIGPEDRAAFDRTGVTDATPARSRLRALRARVSR